MGAESNLTLLSLSFPIWRGHQNACALPRSGILLTRAVRGKERPLSLYKAAAAAAKSRQSCPTLGDPIEATM